jgi:hypothetical protein
LTVNTLTAGAATPSSGNPVTINFRSSNATGSGTFNRTITGALSVVLSSGSTLGFTAAEAGRLYVWAIDNAGTVELALSRTSDIFPESVLVSTTAEGGAGAADSAVVMYSATARTNVPCKCIGYIEITTGATAGEWDNAPTKIQVMGPGIKRTGDTVQRQLFSNTTASDFTTQTPCDNTIPQITEGNQIVSGSFTPTSALNKLKFVFQTNVVTSDAGEVAFHLHEGATANALHAIGQTMPATYPYHIRFECEKVAGVAVATTYQARGGPGGAIHLYTLLATPIGFGGVNTNSLQITEVFA